MTTHYQKIQALGNRMAENLTIMGVPSQFDEGGLTLADKILEISGRVTSGIILYADKKIAQSGDTANLYALVLDDNIAVSGETVRFYSDIHLRSETCSQSDSLYDDYYTSSSKSGRQYDFIGSNDKYIRYNSTTINIFYGSQWSSDFRYTGEFHIKEGVLTYYDSGGVSHTVDVSMVDTTSINSNPITVYYNWVEVTTEDDGVATYEYDCTGSGLREFYATSGTFVSGTFPVFDCYRHDDGTISSHNDIWTGITNTDITREAEYTTIKEKTVGTTATLTFTNIPLKNYRIECDVYQVDGTQDEWFITVLKQDYTAITSADAKLGEWKHISLDLNNIAPNSRVRLNTGGSCTELRFKNFMLYPYGDNDVISINASNPVIQSTETTDITGSLFIEGELQKNTNIDVYKNGTKVDTISTGSTGVASYTYTGTGAGATEFQFKYGSILSEPLTIMDTLFYDEATTNAKESNWATSNLSISYNTGRVVSNSSGSNVFHRILESGSLKSFNTPLAIEFDLISYTGTILTITDGTNQIRQGLGTIGATSNNTIRIEYDGTTAKYYVDGVYKPNADITASNSSVNIGFRISDNASITYKNVKIYPI